MADQLKVDPGIYKFSCSYFKNFVRVEGLEPPCLAAPDPKSGTSANFATPASFSGNFQVPYVFWDGKGSRFYLNLDLYGS